MSTPTVAVIGGGITGLSAAWEIARRSPQPARVVLLEADDRLGGKIRSAEIGGQRVEVGADAFLARRDEGIRLCEEIGLREELVAPGTSGAYVHARGRLRMLPRGLVFGVPTLLGPLAESGICSPKGLGRVALDLLHAPSRRDPTATTDDDEAIGAIVRDRLGDEVHDLLADPLIGGINAGPIDSMSAAAVFPQLLHAARRPGSLMRNLRSDSPTPLSGDAPEAPLFLRPRGGMDALVDRLRERLTERGVEFRLGAPVESLDRGGTGSLGAWTASTAEGALDADGVVLAVPSHHAASLLAPTDRALAGMFGDITYASVTVVTFRFKDDAVDETPEGTGFLVPATGGGLVTACTWMSKKWPQLKTQGEVLVRVSMGRHRDTRHLELTEDEVAGRSLEELATTWGLRAEPLESVVVRWPEAFPQYLVGHLARVRDIEERCDSLAPLAVAGAALHGVGIPACIGSGRRASDLVLARVLDQRGAMTL